MLARLRTHASYANVMASIAVFLALGGGAYALSLGRDSVGSKQIKKSAVKQAELAGLAVTEPKIAAGAVTGTAVLDGSLLGGDFKAGELPQGAQGPTGPTGPTGLRGPSQLLFDTGSSGGAISSITFGNNRDYVIPAGDWWVSWSGQLDTASIAGVETTCRLESTTTLDQRAVTLSSTTDKRPFVLEAMVTGPTTVSHQCKIGTATHTSAVRGFRFVAMTADAVTNLSP